MGSEASDQTGVASPVKPTAGTPEAIAMADEVKKKANEAFQEHHFAKAEEFYTEALQLNPQSAILWANRSFAHTKLEEYGSAIEDAAKAIELDPKYVKGYYRRGTANIAMGKFKEALKDFRQAVQIAPRDPDARQKVRECERAVREAAFYNAISHPEAGPVGQVTVDFESMDVDDTYHGAKLGPDGVTLPFLQQMMADFKEQKSLHRKYAFQILLRAREILRAQPTLLDIRIKDGEHITYYDLLNIFELNGLPSEDNRYLFNGDFVDRGSFSAEVIFTLLAFKCLYPDSFFLARGNHESRSMNKIYGFDGEIKAKFGEKCIELCADVFCCLPLSHVINSKVFVVHGGLFSKDGITLEDIKKVDRFREPPEEGLMCEILWSDPGVVRGRLPSKRGVGVMFGPDVTEKFLTDNGLDLVVRSHEVKDEGYEVEHSGKLITVFSAPNYCDQMGNKGAFIRFEAPDLKPKFTQYSAVTHPNVKPMAYASNFSYFGF